MNRIDTRNLVSVYGSGVRSPLLRTNDARLIQIRDDKGDLQALFTRLSDKLWGFVSRGDPDWEDHRRTLEIDDSVDSEAR